MTEVFSFLLGQIGKAFEAMQNFYIFPSFSVFDFLIILLVLHIVITLFVPTIGKRSGDKADKSTKRGSD